MKCRNDAYLKKIGISRLDKNQEVTFKVLGNLPDCRRMNTRKYVSVIDDQNAELEADPFWNGYVKPTNRYECFSDGCSTSGTLYPGNAAANVVFHIAEDATEWATGVLTFYVSNPGASVVVKISDTKTFTNADSYTITPGTAGADGFIPITIDLAASTPTQVGTGWTPSANGAYIAIKAGGATSGISSIAILDSIFDFEINDVVKVACLTSIDGDFAIDAAETTCMNDGYDTTTAPTFERTVTGRLLTANYDILNPLHGRGSAITGSKPVAVEKVGVASGDYAIVTIEDANIDDCAGFGVTTTDCNAYDATLSRIAIPTPVELDGKHFQVIPQSDGTVDIYLNKIFVGQTVTVAYPKLVDVEDFVGDWGNVGGRRVQMSYIRKTSDGQEWLIEYRNVLITSFPDSMSEDAEPEIEFTVVIQRDADGHYYHKQRILA